MLLGVEEKGECIKPLAGRRKNQQTFAEAAFEEFSPEWTTEKERELALVPGEGDPAALDITVERFAMIAFVV